MSYCLILLDLLLMLLSSPLHLLLHGIERTVIGGVHFFLCLLLFSNGSVQGFFQADKGANIKWWYGLGDIVLSLYHSCEFVEFCEN
jgi:uncharacterized membrane protein YvlD (DUF360 family)